jgi:glycosyltransferase involved in cell wall biosynthesis
MSSRNERAFNPCRNPSIYVVVPSFNEATVLATTIRSLVDLGYSVVVVDDGSSDNTVDVMRHFAVHYLRHPINLGQGASLQTGITYALADGADIVVTFDADGQHPAEQIPELVSPIVTGEADVVLGSRFLRTPDLALVPRSKQVVLRVARCVDGILSGMWLSDSHNGFRAFSRAAAAKIDLRENGFSHATEILVQIRKSGLRYREVPTSIRYSDYSRQKGQRVSNSLNIVMDVMIRKVLK